MKSLRLAMCVAVFALVGGISLSEDLDVRALQAKLAAQEARLNDLQAKMGKSSANPDAIVSRGKKATIKVGGNLAYRYYYHDYKIEAPDGSKAKDVSGGEYFVDTARLEFTIDVNEHFDAFIRLDMTNNRDESANADRAWIRWKNICNSGFGVLVGRAPLTFGSGIGNNGGVVGGWVKNNGLSNDSGNTHNFDGRIAWDKSRILQVAPYWESKDKKFKATLTLAQAINGWNGDNYSSTASKPTWFNNGTDHRTRNDGLGTFALDLVYKPIKGLDLQASFVNMYNKLAGGRDWSTTVARGNFDGASKTTQALFLAASYKYNRVRLYASFIHQWNLAWNKDKSYYAFTYGTQIDITERLNGFVEGDYIRYKTKNGALINNASDKVSGWAASFGFKYNIPEIGASAQLGYRYENVKGERNGNQTHRLKGGTIYSELAFGF